MIFQYRSYERSRSGRTVRVPRLAYFRTVQGFADSETMKLHGPLSGNELQNVKRKFFQTLFKIQPGVIDLRERLIRLAAQVLDAGNEQPALPAEFAVDRTLRTAGQLNDLVDRDALIAPPQKQVCCNFFKLAVSNLSSRPLVRHSPPRPGCVKEIFNAIHRLNPPVSITFY